ncbi:unnamed protein product [Caenorhabditis auriculariae]|uniref:Transmembrane protein n=1 Tax=Caenorhabditis auriculariae TaxID=2777116 RepID=A0A8S1HT97_9PELO|nr:unnamed protein product [Caenorhabditis auriculariae]
MQTKVNEERPPVWICLVLVYSTPFVLFFVLIFLIKWRPFNEFSSILAWIRWYCSFSPRIFVTEFASVEREPILIIDAESLSSISTSTSPFLLRERQTDSSASIQTISV